MKKLLLSCVVLFLLNILHINQSQAQDWQNQKSVTLHTQFPTDTYAQKVKVYNNDYLVGITKKEGVDHYGFVLWKNNDNFKMISLLNTGNIIINDFTLYYDDLFFCGQRLTSQGNYVGIIGHLNMNDFINNGNFQYEYADINTIENLTKIIYYETGLGEKMLTAIGNGSYISSTHAQIVHLNLSNTNTITFNAYPFTNQNQYEVLWDMFYYNDYVITVSNVNLTNIYTIRYFKHNGQYLDNVVSYYFTFPGVNFNLTSNPYHFPLHIADISQDEFAVCVSANDGQNCFTLINFHKKWSHHILSSQLHYHNDKDNKPLEMEYSSSFSRLLLLNDSYFNNMGKVQTMTYIDPFNTNSYNTLMENFNTPNQINHFSLISPKHYAVAGTYSFSQSNNMQLFAIKDINYPYLSCLDNSIVNIDPINTTPGNMCNLLQQYISINITWIIDNANPNIENIIIDCID
jgi:hypothetical protein